MNKITITVVNNGYIVNTEGGIRANGESVYKYTEEFKMLEDIGKDLLQFPIKVVRN